MNGTNGKQSDFPDVALVPYPVIVIRNGKGVKTFRYRCSYSALNVRIAFISLACSLWRISSSTPK